MISNLGPEPTHELYEAISSRVMSYAVDGGRGAVPDAASDPTFAISPTLFLRRLYAPRGSDYESRVVAEILASPHLICLVGKRGTGKTSTLCFVVDAIRQQFGSSARVIPINLKQNSLFTPISPTVTSTELLTSIRRVLCQILFPHDQRPLLAWLLSGPPDTTADDDAELHILSSLYDVAAVLHSRLLTPGLPRSQRIAALSDAFATREDIFSDTLATTLPLLQPAHILLAAQRLSNVWPFIVIYDNVDRLPPQVQSRFLEVLNDQHLALAGICSTVVAIRRENIRGAVPRPNAGGDLITVIMPDDEQYPGLLLRPPEGDYVRDVLERRDVYARELCAAYARRAKQEAPVLPTGVHSGAVTQLIASAIHNLANGSVRVVASTYSGFREYLAALVRRNVLRLPDAVVPDSDEERHLQTLFYLWLRSQNASLVGLTLLSSLRLHESRGSSPCFAATASPTYLLLPCVYNLIAERGGFDGPEAAPHREEVFGRMTELGFSRSQLDYALTAVLGRGRGFSAAIEYVYSDADSPEFEADVASPLRLTDMGREFIRHTITRVGFVWGHAYALRYGGLHGSRDYHAMTQLERTQLLYDFLARMAEEHLRLLALLPSEWRSRYGSDWLRLYCTRFGLNNQLLVERLATSAERFYAPHYPRTGNPFETLKQAYLALLARLDSEGDTANLPFAELQRGWELLRDAAD